MSSHAQPNDLAGGAPGVQAPTLAEQLAGPLVALLNEYGVTAEELDPSAARFHAVPVGEHFSESRTSLILRRLIPGSSHVYLDSDLVCRRPEPNLASVLAGPCRDSWRRLQLPPLPGSVNEVLCQVLELLGSPLAGRARAVLGLRPRSPPAASLGLLGASPAEADWEGSDQIGPDVIAAASQPPWTDNSLKE